MSRTDRLHSKKAVFRATHSEGTSLDLRHCKGGIGFDPTWLIQFLVKDENLGMIGTVRNYRLNVGLPQG